MRTLISLFTIAFSCVLSQAASINWTNHVANIQAATNGYFGTSVNIGAGFADAYFYPDSGPGVTPFRLQSSLLRLGGNILEVSNGPGFMVLSVDYAGLLSAPDLLLTGDASVQGAVLTDHVVATNGVVTGGLTNTSVSQLQGAVTANKVTSTNVITAQAGINTAGMTNTGVTVHTPSAIQTLAAGTVIAWDSSTERIAGSGGAVTLTGTPTIQTNGVPDGALITIRGTSDANTVTLQDYRLLTGTCIAMEMGSVTLLNGSEIRFQWSVANQKWQQIGFSANSSQNHVFANVTAQTNFYAGPGALGAPSFSFTGDPNTGFWNQSANRIGMSLDGILEVLYIGSETRFKSSEVLSWSPGSPSAFAGDTFISRPLAATIQLGQDAASPITQTFKAHNGAGTDKAGAALFLAGGQSTGTGVSGGVSIETALTGEATGSTTNAYQNRGWFSPKYIALTDSSAVTIQTFPLPANKVIGGQIIVTIYATNAVPHAQVITDTLTFSAAAIGTTIYGNISTNTPANVFGGDTGTLTCTYGFVDNGNNTFSIQATPVSSLTTPVERCRRIILLNSNFANTTADP